MGCKLLEIMADGLHAIFHRFEAFLKKVDAQAVTVGWPSNGRRASSISALLLQPLKQAPAGLPAPSSPRPALLAGLTAPPYSHRWPSHPSTHPHLLLFSGDGKRTSRPSYSRTPLRVGNNCRVFPGSVSFPSPRRRPPPWCSRRGVVNVVKERLPSDVDCTWRG